MYAVLPANKHTPLPMAIIVEKFACSFDCPAVVVANETFTVKWTYSGTGERILTVYSGIDSTALYPLKGESGVCTVKSASTEGTLVLDLCGRERKCVMVTDQHLQA